MWLLFVLIIIIAITLFIVDKFWYISDDAIVQEIDQNLPQAMCGRCGYASCKEFAKALSKNDTSIVNCNLITEDAAEKIRKITGETKRNLQINEDFKVAYIDPDKCIGCTKCAKVCPTDCIIGSIKMEHTVVEENCSGCRLCTKECPTGAISLKDSKLFKVEIK